MRESVRQEECRPLTDDGRPTDPEPPRRLVVGALCVAGFLASCGTGGGRTTGSDAPSPAGPAARSTEAAGPLPAAVAAHAQSIVDGLTRTAYRHVEYIDRARGIYDCDCNGFVGLVLSDTAPDHYAMIPREADQERPRAFRYVEFFAALTDRSVGGWRRIDFLRDARPGDVMAWRFPDLAKGHDTGHVFIVAGRPEADGAGILTLRVDDSADGPHFDDTRGTGPGRFPNGVGSGVLKFRTDGAGRPTAFRFAPSSGYVRLPMAIGRLEPLPAP